MNRNSCGSRRDPRSIAGPAAEAAEGLRKAVDLARTQHAGLLEERAARTLAALNVER